MAVEKQSEEEYLPQDKGFPLLDLPLLVLEKVISFINDPFDLKSIRLSCKTFRDIIHRDPGCLVHLKVIPKDLKDLENVVKNESKIKWNNFRFPPELYYVGCRTQYAQTFNTLFTEFTEVYAPYIEILEMDRFDMSNVCHINLLRKCQKLVSFKVDAMMMKNIKEQQLKDVLEDPCVLSVLRKLENLDVVVFEFLKHDYQFEFMGKFLNQCTELQSVGSWGYFPEWEQPIGGWTHLKYFVWPLLSYLRSRIRIVDLMMETLQSSEDLAQLNLKFLNDMMDWQAGKWTVDLRKGSNSDFSSLEKFLYSRVKSYAHRAVGWFDEAEFRKCGLSLMTNLSSIHIHNARDINLTEENPFTNDLFPKLENLTLIAGNRLNLEHSLPLEKVVVGMLLNTKRPTVTTLKLDIDLDHHDEYGSICLPLVIQNFPNLKSFWVEEWGPSDSQMLAVYKAFPCLEALMFCGRNLSDIGILGDEKESESGICQLKCLRILKIFSLRLPPKNVFPWPIKENNQITDKSFVSGFSQLPLRKFHFLLKSNKITTEGITSLCKGKFSTTSVEFLVNWLPKGVNCAHAFEEIHTTFKFLDQNTFLEPANFVIPDIGNWVL